MKPTLCAWCESCGFAWHVPGLACAVHGVRSAMISIIPQTIRNNTGYLIPAPSLCACCTCEKEILHWSVFKHSSVGASGASPPSRVFGSNFLRRTVRRLSAHALLLRASSRYCAEFFLHPLTVRPVGFEEDGFIRGG